MFLNAKVVVVLYENMKVEKEIFLDSLILKEQCQFGPLSSKSLFLYLTEIKDWQRNNTERNSYKQICLLTKLVDKYCKELLANWCSL